MPFLIEGVDGAGKSTLVRQLALPSKHHDRPKGDPYQEYRTSYSSDHFRVFDRGHISEHIYGPILRLGDRLGRAKGRQLERTLSIKNFVLIICEPPWDVICKHWEPDDIVTNRDQLNEIYWAYKEFYTPIMPMVRYDWTKTSFEAQL